MSAPATEALLKALDRPATSLACAVGRAGARVARPRRAPAGTLIVRPGGMGDLIMAQLAVEALGLDPRRDVTWLISERSAAWARVLDLPHELHDRQPLRVLARLAGRYALVVNSEQRFGLSQAAALMATGGELVAFATNRAARHADRTVAYDPYDTHESLAFRRLMAEALGREDDGADLRVARRRPAAGHRLVMVSGRQSPTRALDLPRWVQTVRAWAPEGGTVVCAAPVDQAFADELAAAVGGHRRAAGFAELVDLVATAHDVLTVDGGPVHMASYFGVPVRAVFTSGRERKWHPLGAGSSILRTTGLPCQPCTVWGQTPPCPNRLACHRLDPVADVRPVA